MRKRVVHKLVLAWIAASLLFLTGNAQAVSLEKIEVASFLGEPLYAEIPLKLDAAESLTKVVVEIASASEYKIFEVFRDQVLKSIRADVVSDSRGTRVELSSRTSLKSPFFNLVLKVHYGRVTHFKRFPVFLELPKSIRTVAKKKPLPSVKATPSPAAAQPQVASKAVAAKDGAAPVFVPHDGWARTGRYGPIVRGDSLSTIAKRLRIDHRYSLNQVMAAIFEKNRSKFNQDNMNLLKAGSYLDVPKAAEVERLSKSQAYDVLADHEKRWKQLTKQPRYAAEKEAQRTRYSKRVRVGHRAGGAASTLATAEALKAPVKVETPPITEKPTATTKTTGVEAAQDATAESGSSALIASLKKENAELQMQLEENEKQLNLKIVSAAKAANEASETAIAKLNVLVAQLQDKLEEVRKEVQSKQGGSPSWKISLLYGLIVVLLGVVALLVLRRRREPVHPAVAVDKQEIEAPVVVPETRIEKVVEQADAGITAPADTDIDRETESFSEIIPDVSDEFDTAEIEPVDTTPEEILRPDVDHLSDADMYIRYGMEEEALQQVDVALRLQPENVEAHIMKVEVLRSSKNSKGFEEAVAAAGSVLGGAALERFNSVVADLNDSDTSSDDIAEGFSEPVESGTEAFTVLDDSETKVEAEADRLDEDIPDVPQSDSADMSGQSATSDLDDIGEMEWLTEVPLASDDFLAPEEVGQQPEVSGDQEAQAEETTDMDVEGSTQELDDLLSGFSGDDDDILLDESVLEQTGQEADWETSMDTERVTQKFDNLLSELQQETGEQESLDDRQMDDEASGHRMDRSIDPGIDIEGDVTQELDNLLSELQQGAGEQESLNDSQTNDEVSDDQPDGMIDPEADSKPAEKLDDQLSKSPDDEDEKKE